MPVGFTMIDDELVQIIPPGWTWTLYSATDRLPARAVLVSPDYRIHIGREGRTADGALRDAANAARAGMRD